MLIDKHRSEGKAAALNDAVACSSGDILIMTDARQRFGISELDHDTVRELIAGLSNPTVGCVSGELRFIDERSHTLQKDLGLYWRFEKWIRQNEARFDSVPGVTGAIYAMRRELFSPIPPQTIPRNPKYRRMMTPNPSRHARSQPRMMSRTRSPRKNHFETRLGSHQRKVHLLFPTSRDRMTRPHFRSFLRIAEKQKLVM